MITCLLCGKNVIAHSCGDVWIDYQNEQDEEFYFEKMNNKNIYFCYVNDSTMTISIQIGFDVKDICSLKHNKKVYENLEFFVNLFKKTISLYEIT